MLLQVTASRNRERLKAIMEGKVTVQPSDFEVDEEVEGLSPKQELCTVFFNFFHTHTISKHYADYASFDVANRSRRGGLRALRAHTGVHQRKEWHSFSILI